jgi:hypothetical protein
MTKNLKILKKLLKEITQPYVPRMNFHMPRMKIFMPLCLDHSLHAYQVMIIAATATFLNMLLQLKLL